MGVTDLTFFSESVIDAVYTAVAQLALAYVKQALIARTDPSTCALLATHDCHSL